MKKNEILSFTNKWIELKNIILSNISQAQNTKSPMFFLNVDFRSRENTVMYNWGHMLRGDHIRESWCRYETQNMKVFDVSTAEVLIDKT
jgi:hypothetical protein